MAQCFRILTVVLQQRPLMSVEGLIRLKAILKHAYKTIFTHVPLPLKHSRYHLEGVYMRMQVFKSD